MPRVIRTPLVMLLLVGLVFSSLWQILPVQKTKAAVGASMYILVSAGIQDSMAAPQAKIYCKTNSGEFIDSGRYAQAGVSGYCQVSYNRNNTYQIQVRRTGYISATSQPFTVDQRTYNALPNGQTANSKNYQFPTTLILRVDTANPPPPTPPTPPAGATPVGHATASSTSEPITDQMAPRNVSISVDTYAIKSAKVTINWEKPTAGPVANADNSVLSANFVRYEIARLDDAISENYLNNALYNGAGGTVNDLNTTTFSQIVNSARPDSKYCYYIKGVYGSTGAVSDRPCIDLTDNANPRAFMQSSYSGSWPDGTLDSTADANKDTCGNISIFKLRLAFDIMGCIFADMVHQIAGSLMKKATEYLQASIGIDSITFETPATSENMTGGGGAGGGETTATTLNLVATVNMSSQASNFSALQAAGPSQITAKVKNSAATSSILNVTVSNVSFDTPNKKFTATFTTTETIPTDWTSIKVYGGKTGDSNVLFRFTTPRPTTSPATVSVDTQAE